MDEPTKNKTWDVTNGKLRFYEPSNLGINVTNNMWSTDGIGVLGSRAVSQPNIEFKLETFGLTLKENYEMFTEFVNDLLGVPYVTLEYQTESFQVFADIALVNVTKTEGYGQHGQFSETIEFEMVTKWYTFENLTFKTLQNGEIIDGVSKVYGGVKSKMKLPNFNLVNHTKMLVDTSDTLLYGGKGGSTATMTHEHVSIPGLPSVKDGVRVTQTSQGQSGWSSQRGNSFGVVPGADYTVSAYIRNNGIETLSIGMYLGVATELSGGSIKFLPIFQNVNPSEKFALVTQTITIPEGYNYAWCYIYTAGTTVIADWSFAGFKVEKGERTPYLPTESEMTALDYAPYAGYRYIENQAYTYYGETDIGRLSRWDIDSPFFSFIARLTPVKGLPNNQEYGLQFLNMNGNQYSAILFTFETAPDQIEINTDVNDEYYLSVLGTNTVNAFPELDFQAYRTRIFTEGQMVMKNLSNVEIRVKRKVDFI